MKKILFLLLSCFILQNASGQCPDTATRRANGTCVTLTWTLPQSTFPTTLDFDGVNYNVSSTTSTSATYLRDGSSSCASATQNLSGTITFTLDNTTYTCTYANGNLTGSVHPIDLTTFSTTVQSDKSVLVRWTYANAIDFERFGVEHSTDGRSWMEISSIDLPGYGLRSNELSFTHRNPISGYNYYRLRMIDLDGTNTLSDVERVFIESEKLIHLVNTSVHTDLLVQRGMSDEDTHLMIYDLSGKSIQRDILTSGESIFNLNISGLNPGMYILHATSLNRMESHKFMKVQ